MSVIGPRPGLWNQDILTAERDKYNANDVKPGLTGWAQINGRDELEIPDKAKLDGEYVSKMGLTFAQKYSQEDKIIFLKRCQEMYYDLKNYKKGLNEDEIRKDVKECENALKYME